MAFAMAFACIGGFFSGANLEKVYASDGSENFFVEGEGAGGAFSKSSWDFETTPEGTLDNRYTGDEFKAGIYDNPHTDEKEPVIRLISGLEKEQMTADLGNDVRSGSAFMKQGIKLDGSSEFSVKFTFSMPEACRKHNYSRVPGGDGIVFFITSDEEIDLLAGGAIGYKGIENSVGVEFDSFFNTGNGMGYNDPNPTTTPPTNDRQDHVAVVLNGNNTRPEYHYGTTFLFESGYLDGFTGEGSLTTTKEDVDTRRFTAWIEYDGNGNLYVSYAQGSFEEAVRPDDPQIHIDEATYPEIKAQLDAFGGKDVRVGFSSSIGSSKANHTIHSIAFVNKYIDDGITLTYTQKYYVENPYATEDFIEIDGKKYVLDKISAVMDATLGVPTEIVDLSSSYGSDRILRDYDALGYPSSVPTIASDGTTVLYQFYDLYPRTSYTEKYIIEVDKPASGDVAIEVDGTTYKVVETVEVDDVWVGLDVEITDKSQEDVYADYEVVPSTTKLPSSIDDIADDGSSVVYQIFKKKPVFTVKYYVEVEKNVEGAIKIGDKYYVVKTEETESYKAPSGSKISYAVDGNGAGIKIGDSSIDGSIKKFDNYTFSKDATDAYGKVGGVLSSDSSMEIILVYNLPEKTIDPAPTPTPEPTPEPTPKPESPNVGSNICWVMLLLVVSIGLCGCLVVTRKRKLD